MQKQMNEQEIINEFDSAIKNNDLYIVIQPQINHSTGRMVGAEALIRWKHPIFGMQYPNDFIPIFERNNLIIKADLFVFEEVCKFIKYCLDNNLDIVPISVNMSRYDIYNNDYVNSIENIRKKYDVPVKYLRVELTESSAIGGLELVTSIIDELHKYGYIVEMDDFGSGYSSLNILKDLNVDIVKLDMRFIEGESTSTGGIIVTSVIHMLNWLKKSIIAEGVETIEKADYLRSIGCKYIQGYLYSKPLDKSDFIEKLKQTKQEPIEVSMKLVTNMNAEKFWNSDSLETVIFSSFVGGAAILNYNTNTQEINILRLNKKYLKEIGMNQEEAEIIKEDPLKSLGPESKKAYIESLNLAIETNEEQEVETWRNIHSDCCGATKICILTEMKCIGHTGNDYLIYTLIRNVTNEKNQYIQLSENNDKLMSAADHANIYAWEYFIDTKEMRPCFRCMRDLGLPPLIKNYPEPLIENGLFPQDYADMYRAMMKRIDEGSKTEEAIIPLTVGRVPFYVRYTTEFDENGKPLKAYGSATLVIDNQKQD